MKHAMNLWFGRSLTSAAKTARRAAAAFLFFQTYSCPIWTKSVSFPPPPERKEIQKKTKRALEKKGGRGISPLLKEGHREEGAVVQWSVCRWRDTRGRRRQPRRMRDNGGGPGEGPGERRSTPKHEHRVPPSGFCFSTIWARQPNAAN